MSNTDPGRSRITKNQESQLLARTGDTAARACRFRKFRDRLPNPHALEQKQRTEDDC